MIEIKPLERLDATVRIPGSKSYTQRAMVIAALAEGESRLTEVLLAEDTAILARALEATGRRNPDGGHRDARPRDRREARPSGAGDPPGEQRNGDAPPHGGGLPRRGADRPDGGPAAPGAAAEAPSRRPRDPRGRDPHRRRTRLSPGDDPGRPSAGRGGAPPGHRKQPVRLGAPDRRPLRGRRGNHRPRRDGSPPSPTSRSPWRRWGPSASTSPWTGPAATW